MHASLADALTKGPPPPGNLAVPTFAHGSLTVELYTPKDIDPQSPHTRDEIYIVVRGSGHFVDGDERYPVQEGSFIF
ncbi:MAG: cupin domain-containing protein, partial [Verrucomicrobiota bacterium]